MEIVGMSDICMQICLQPAPSPGDLHLISRSSRLRRCRFRCRFRREWLCRAENQKRLARRAILGNLSGLTVDPPLSASGLSARSQYVSWGRTRKNIHGMEVGSCHSGEEGGEDDGELHDC